MSPDFDVIVVGGGPAGEHCAAALAEGGLRVAIVERELLGGVWTTREATGMTELPRRLLILGGGPVGVELAQAVARMGGSVALVEGMDRVLAREPHPLGEAIGAALSADGVELRLGQHASGARRVGGDFVLDFPDGSELRGDRLLVAT